MRMSQAPEIKREPPAATDAPRPGPLPFDPEGRGPSEFRRLGAVLRRLLALSDWGALLAVLCAITASSSSTDVGDLFWMVLFSPAWVIVVKLQGLYDNDHRRLRHSTLDELPSLVTATVLATLVLDALMAISPAGPLSPAAAIGVGVGTFLLSFSLRGSLRFLWHRLTAEATGLVIGPAKAVDLVARRGSTGPRPTGKAPALVSGRENAVARVGGGVPPPPERGRARVGSLSPQPGRGAGGRPRLASPADISRIAREQAIERVVVTEPEMS